MKKEDRMPKKEYFQKRLAEAKERGDERKADYYQSRLSEMEFEYKGEGKNPHRTKTTRTEGERKVVATEQDWGGLHKRVKAKFDSLDETGKLIEANKFYKACEKKGITMNSAMAFLSEAGVEATIVLHGMTF